MSTRRSGFADKGVFTILAVVAVAVSAAVTLQACGDSKVARTTSGPSDAAVLLSDIKEYRVKAASLDPKAATLQWFALYDRAAATAKDESLVFDGAILDFVGERSLLAALPPPQAWPAFRAEAGRRAGVSKPDTRQLGLRYLAEVLTGDHATADATLRALEGKENRDLVIAARSLLARIYGNAEAQIAAFRQSLDIPASEYDELNVPDLVAMVGEEQATALLAEAMKSGRNLRIEGGEATRALARRVALANVDRMKVPQWWLADSVEAAPLYEAMSKRFRAGRAQKSERGYDWPWRHAASYYFLQMVRTGRQSDAEEALIDLANGNAVEIPRAAIDALQRAQLNEPLFRFLDGVLARRPELNAWDVYIEQAAYTGQSAKALALIERLLRREDVPAGVRADLQARRVAALLAADRIGDARAAVGELLAKRPQSGDASRAARVQVAIKAARAGRLLEDQALADLGLDFLLAAVDLPKDAEAGGTSGDELRALLAELRHQGRSEQALQIANRKLEQKPTFAEAMTRRMGVQSDDDRALLVEIAGIHSAAGRHAEVLSLLSTSPRWGAADLGDVVAVEDSQRQPLGAIVARAFQAKGDDAVAIRVARATVAGLPGRDAGYEIIAALDSSASATFDGLYANDEYEERPLIWKASVQLAAGATDDAEATIRRAIAVDPSDGEQGSNDRMRAYAVLAEILRRKGNAREAQLYANAVGAIRLSERGDEFHTAGLYERAFAAYRQALEKFSDAYCIQSRLAVQLNKQGRRKEALEHYRRAYELMPSSFGRVESHCFGCENVFQDQESQSLAERVFNDIIRKSPGKPQAHYLLAYLREQQGRYADAVQPLRAAVSLDAHYLNAWKRLNDLADKTYLDAGERDIARLKLLELDPLQRHAHYQLDEVGQLSALWNGSARAQALAVSLAAPGTDLYSLRASAELRASANKDVPAEMVDLYSSKFANAALKGPAVTLYEHALIANARALMGLEREELLD